jgi:hypothetical protein
MQFRPVGVERPDEELPPETADPGQGAGPSVAAIRGFWRQFFVRAFDPYRPELHYMRGPGPAWRAKHKAVSPAVQSMLVEIRAAKALRPPAR